LGFDQAREYSLPLAAIRFAIEAGLLGRACRQGGGGRLVRLVAGIKTAAPDRTLNQTATQLEAVRRRTPRGGTRWHPSSVRHLLGQA